MKNKVVLLTILLVLSTLAVGSLSLPEVKSIEVSYPVTTASSKTIWVPDNFTSIQEAINNATEGDTILVSSGTYYENVVVNKSVSLIGEDNETTIIDGNNTGTVVQVEADNISISSFTIRKSGCGCARKSGINVQSYHQNVNVTNNLITQNGFGIRLNRTNSITVTGNNITNNEYDGIALDRSSNNTVFGNSITNNDNIGGITLTLSYNNTVSNNIASKNTIGIYLSSSRNNLIFHNNFVDNTQQVYSHNSKNIWDNSFEGNYWSDYSGVDSNNDGIGDTPHVIDPINQDNYPLMGTFSCFNTSPGKHVNVISNSTIDDFRYFESNSTIKMYVSNMTLNQTYGFGRVCIPYSLMNGSNISVAINDGLTPVLHQNYALYDNGTHRWIYYAYAHSTNKIVIIPEFPSALILPLLMIVTLVAVVLRKTFWKERLK